MKNLSIEITTCFCYLRNKLPGLTLHNFLVNDFFNLYSMCPQSFLSDQYRSDFNFDTCLSNFEIELDNLYQENTISNISLSIVSSQDEFYNRINNFSFTNKNQFNYINTPILSDSKNILTVFLIAIYAVLILMSIMGNILVIIVMSCGFRSSYLDISIFLVNLGIFNLTMSIFCIPFTFVNEFF